MTVSHRADARVASPPGTKGPWTAPIARVSAFGSAASEGDPLQLMPGPLLPAPPPRRGVPLMLALRGTRKAAHRPPGLHSLQIPAFIDKVTFPRALQTAARRQLCPLFQVFNVSRNVPLSTRLWSRSRTPSRPVAGRDREARTETLPCLYETEAGCAMGSPAFLLGDRAFGDRAVKGRGSPEPGPLHHPAGAGLPDKGSDGVQNLPLLPGWAIRSAAKGRSSS
jgi:hypothetical protein